MNQVNTLYEVDHIDPRWVEGRDYQLICGLDIPDNLVVRERVLNTRKSNRFLPYRGLAPVNPGDMAVFYDPETQDWRLDTFMGEWWHKTTNPFCGPGQPAGERLKQVLRDRAGQPVSEESRQKMSDSHKGMVKKWVIETNQREFICPECGKIIRSKGNLTQHIRAKHNAS